MNKEELENKMLNKLNKFVGLKITEETRTELESAIKECIDEHLVEMYLEEIFEDKSKIPSAKELVLKEMKNNNKIMNCNACANNGIEKPGIYSKKLLMEDESHLEEWIVPLCLEHYEDINKALCGKDATITVGYGDERKVILKNYT